MLTRLTAAVGRREINLRHLFAGQKLGINEVSEKIWLATFMHYDLRFFDQLACRPTLSGVPRGLTTSKWARRFKRPVYRQDTADVNTWPPISNS